MTEKKLVWYRVTFLIKAHGTHIVYAKDCFAANGKDAKASVSDQWYADHTNHMFHVEAFRMTKLAAMDTHFIKSFTDITGKGGLTCA